MWGSSQPKTACSWIQLQQPEQLEEIEKKSLEVPVIILKHSTRCSHSAMAKNRLEIYWDKDVPMLAYYLDLLTYRSISDEIAKRYHIVHQSPQVLLFKNGQCIFHASHHDINYNQLKSLI